jgi:DNA transformation protein and related proteins
MVFVKSACQLCGKQHVTLVQTKLSSLPGLGPKSQAMLAIAGITSAEQLRKLGSVRAFAMVKRTGVRPSLNLLWALEGALTAQHWQRVAKESRTSLLLALEEHERDFDQLK